MREQTFRRQRFCACKGEKEIFNQGDLLTYLLEMVYVGNVALVSGRMLNRAAQQQEETLRAKAKRQRDEDALPALPGGAKRPRVLSANDELLAVYIHVDDPFLIGKKKNIKEFLKKLGEYVNLKDELILDTENSIKHLSKNYAKTKKGFTPLLTAVCLGAASAAALVSVFAAAICRYGYSLVLVYFGLLAGAVASLGAD